MSIDNCLLPDENRVAVTSLTPTSNLNGELTLSSIEELEAGFRDNIVASVGNDPLTTAVQQYGSDIFYNNLNSINKVLTDGFVVAQVVNYETLSKRLDAGKLTAFEFAQYLSDYSLSPTSANYMANQESPKFLKSLDDFYTDSFADSVMGGFCSLMPNIFGAIGAFFGLIGKVEGLVNDALSFISKIKNIENLLLAAFEKIKVKALIEAIQAKVTKAVMAALSKVQDAIANFSIEDVINKVETFVTNTVGKQIKELKEATTKFFSEENLKSIERKLKDMINYAVSLFENPSLEEIQFLVARICGFAAGIESIISGLKKPMDSAADRFINTVALLRNASGVSSAERVRAGAIRFDDRARLILINRSRELYVKAGNPAHIDDIERIAVPTWDEIKNNTHPKIRIEGNWIKVLKEDGWNKMGLDFRVMVMRLQAKLKLDGIIDGPLTLNSGWRSQQYNASLKNSAKNSMHLPGLAADVKWSGFSSRSAEIGDFVRVARGLGFNGIGYYKTFMHVDLGEVRSWDKR